MRDDFKPIFFKFLLTTLITLTLSCSNRGGLNYIEKSFKENNLQGTFVLHNIKEDSFVIYNSKRSEIELPPASTFKIFNSLIGLTTGAVQDTNEIFYRYDGSKMFLKSWEEDMNLKKGIRVSQVPAYQKLATLIGYTEMKSNIARLNYGNKEIGTLQELTTFWLQGPLKISAIQQAEILAKLATESLNYPKQTQQAVKKICLLKSGKNWALYGKTGWASRNIETPVGWFVGWLESAGSIYSFALNMDNPTAAQLPLREEITINALKEFGLLND